ncbi:Rrp15p-domain-containing protein [Polychytrium aggregatum]|uniref:Rrp15p-domain-containing protein n=1 Tax=Polychytrium aggregatum TaxID=110093 RepID=UPI0022FE359B|nr:Rrp15p-domain-containing protein [Polychytrium aggregatum]KAI9209775.1 Rrp15p-domain-containing protein [Polychytrium aggregatum]
MGPKKTMTLAVSKKRSAPPAKARSGGTPGSKKIKTESAGQSSGSASQSLDSTKRRREVDDADENDDNDEENVEAIDESEEKVEAPVGFVDSFDFSGPVDDKAADEAGDGDDIDGADDGADDEGDESDDFIDELDDDLDELEGEDQDGDDDADADEDSDVPDGQLVEKQQDDSKGSKLASAIGRILSKKLSKGDIDRPILAQKKEIERAIDEEKLESKATRTISVQKKAELERGHVVPDHTTTDYEKKLRKLATKGVVQLFNAIRAAQKSADEVSTGVQKNNQAVPVVSKSSFLDMIKRPQKSASGSTDETPKQSQPDASKKDTPGGGVAWTKSDYMLQAPKHWDESDGEESA